MEEEVRERERIIARPRCPYCHEDVEHGEPLQVCTACHAFHHGPCWSELGGCAACGSERVLPQRRVRIQPPRPTPRQPAPVRGWRTRAVVAALVVAAAAGGAIAKLSSPTVVVKFPVPSSTFVPAPVEAHASWRQGLQLEAEPRKLNWTNYTMRLPAGMTWTNGREYYWGEDLGLEVESDSAAGPSTNPPGEAKVELLESGRGNEARARLVTTIGSLTLRFTSKTVPARTLERLLLRSAATIAGPPKVLSKLPPETVRPELERVPHELGFSVLEPTDGLETVQLREAGDAKDLTVAISRARPMAASELLELTVPGALLPWRAVYTRLRGERRYLALVAAGVVDGKAIVLETQAPVSAREQETTEAARLMALADSVERLSDDVAWPSLDVVPVDLPGGAGKVRVPRGWALVEDQPSRRMWRGFRGDSIELVVRGYSEPAPSDADARRRSAPARRPDRRGRHLGPARGALREGQGAREGLPRVDRRVAGSRARASPGHAARRRVGDPRNARLDPPAHGLGDLGRGHRPHRLDEPRRPRGDPPPHPERRRGHSLPARRRAARRQRGARPGSAPPRLRHRGRLGDLHARERGRRALPRDAREMSELQERERLIANPRCPYCHEDVPRGEALQVCSVCHAFHHRECWGELGGCASCGAGRVSPARRPVRVERRPQPTAPRARWPRALAFALCVVSALAGAGLSRIDWSGAPTFPSLRPLVPPPGETRTSWREGLSLEDQETNLGAINMRLPAGLLRTNAADFRWGDDVGFAYEWGPRKALIAKHGAVTSSPTEAAVIRKSGARGNEFGVVLSTKGEAVALRLLSKTVPTATLEKLLRKSVGTIETTMALGLVRTLPPELPSAELVRRSIGAGFTALLPLDGSVTVELDDGRRKHVKGSETILELHVPGALLPDRVLFRRRSLRPVLVLDASGTYEGERVKLTAEAEDTGSPVADAARLTAIVDSVQRTTPRELNDLSPCPVAVLPAGAGSVRFPESWRREATGISSFVATCSTGESIELIVSSNEEPRFHDDGEFVTSIPISERRRIDVFAVGHVPDKRRAMLVAMAQSVAQSWKPAP
jgi:hypothetical protein